jgi:hypothetical protein
MSKRLLVLSLTAALVAALAVAASAFAQSEDPPATPAPGAGWGRGYGPMMGGGFRGGMMGGAFGQRMMAGTGAGPMHDAMHDALAEAFGFTRAEWDAQLAAGETPWTIAQAKGRSAEEFAAIMQAARAEAIEQAVASGALTREQADWMLQHMGGRTGGWGLGRGPAGCPMHPGVVPPATDG